MEILQELIPLAKAQFAARLQGRPPAAPSPGRRLHGRHAGALSRLRSGEADRRAHGQAREPLDLDQVPPPHRAHRNAGPRLALQFHVQQPVHRRFDGAGARRPVPPAVEWQADHRHPARWLPRRGAGFGRVGDVPHGLRVRRVERRAAPLLVACEEAHRYAPADKKQGFGPTLKALSRIAKEGRKYGVFLGCITQRPADLDATILSQCSTVFAMRLSNDRDQAIIRSAVPDAGSSLVAFCRRSATARASPSAKACRCRPRFRFKDVARRAPAAQPVRQSGPVGRERRGRRPTSSTPSSIAGARQPRPTSARALRSWVWTPTASRKISTTDWARRLSRGRVPGRSQSGTPLVPPRHGEGDHAKHGGWDLPSTVIPAKAGIQRDHLRLGSAPALDPGFRRGDD